MAFVASQPPAIKTKLRAVRTSSLPAQSPRHEPEATDHGRSASADLPFSIGGIHDEQEREADAVADAVMSGSSLRTTLHSSANKVQRACAKCSEDEELRMKVNASGGSDSGSQTSRPMAEQINRLRRGGGRPLPTAVDSFMSQRFDRDLGRVRVHTGIESDRLNRTLNAKAFTVGNDLFFGRNQFQPQQRGGQHLIAHEITHTLQQQGPAGASDPPVTIRRANLDGGQTEAEPNGAGDAKSCNASMPDPLQWQMDPTLTTIRTAKPGASRQLFRRGSSGPAVVMVQQALQAWGCGEGLELLPEFGADGQFGRETKDAVKEFQRVHGGGVDGVIGPLTLFQLEMFVVGEPVSGGGGIVVEDNFDGEMGDSRRMRRTEFIEAVEAETCALAQRMLANTSYTIEDCGALSAFLAFLTTMAASDIEQAIIAGAPAAARALSARQLLDAVLQQVRSSISKFLAGGQDIATILTELGAPDSVIKLAKQEMDGGGQGQTQKKETGSGGGATLNPVRVQQQLRDGGRPLEAGVRSRMETAMASDFGGVRVHTSRRAAELASSMHARAFTVGNEVGFAPGEYRPGDLVGDALIAHELAHVQQQSGATEAAPSASGFSQLEDAADQSALAAMLRTGGRGLARLVESIGGLGAKAIPRLRSGLRLSRCAGPTPKLSSLVPEPGKVNVGSPQGYCEWLLGGPDLANRGMKIRADFDLPDPHVPGSVEIVQFVDACREATVGPDKLYKSIVGRDGRDPFDYSRETGISGKTREQVGANTTSGWVKLEDSPGQGFGHNPKPDKLRVNDHFQTFVTWTPARGERMLLGGVTWGWKGEANTANPSDCDQWALNKLASGIIVPTPTILDEPEPYVAPSTKEADRKNPWSGDVC